MSKMSFFSNKKGLPSNLMIRHHLCLYTFLLIATVVLLFFIDLLLWHADDKESLSSLNLLRRHHIRQQCDSLNVTSLPLDWSNWNDNRSGDFSRYDIWFKRLVVSEPLKLVYCPIPKGAYTNIINYLFNIDAVLGNLTSGYRAGFEDYDRVGVQRSLFREFHDRYGFNGNHSLNFLSSYPIERAREIMATYRKMIFVRNPLHRFVSAWQDKFAVAKKQPDMARIALEILRRYRNESTTELKNATSIKVELEEFAHFLYDHNGTDRMNWHWMPQWIYCAVCQIDYDFVGRTEHLSDEFAVFLKKLTANRYDLPPLPRSTSPSNRTEKEYITKNVAAFEYLLKAMKKHYLEDFFIFNYNFQ